MANNVNLALYEMISGLPSPVTLPLTFANSLGYVVDGGNSVTRTFRLINNADSSEDNSTAMNMLLNTYPVNATNVAIDPGDGTFDPATMVGNGDQVSFYTWLNVKCTTLQSIVENNVFEGPGTTFDLAHLVAQDESDNYKLVVRKSVEVTNQAVTRTDMGGNVYIFSLTDPSATKYDSTVVDGSPIPILYITDLTLLPATTIDLSAATIVYNGDSVTISGAGVLGASSYVMSYYILEEMTEGSGAAQYLVTDNSEYTTITLGTALLATEFIECNYVTDYDATFTPVGRRYSVSPAFVDSTAYIGGEAFITDINLSYIESDPNGLYEKDGDERIFNTIHNAGYYADFEAYIAVSGSIILEGPDNFQIVLSYDY